MKNPRHVGGHCTRCGLQSNRCECDEPSPPPLEPCPECGVVLIHRVDCRTGGFRQ